MSVISNLSTSITAKSKDIDICVHGSPRAQQPLGHPPYLTCGDDDAVWAEYYRVPKGYLFRLIDLSDFIISSDGRSCVSHAVPGLDVHTLEHIYRQQVRPLLWNRQGKLIFHASCVNIAGSAYAFMGESGLGKSTLATAFAQQGYPFLCDDGLLIDATGSGYFAYPNDASIRLWHESGDALLTSEHKCAAPISYTDKLRVLAASNLPHCDKPIPLRGVFFLERQEVENLSIRKLNGAEKHVNWANSNFILDVWDKASTRPNFYKTAQLADQIPSYSLDYPRSFAQVEALVHALVKFIEKKN